MSNSSLDPSPMSLPYIVLLSGTHVTGKDTIAVSLSTFFSCPWIKGGQIGDSAARIAESQSKRGLKFETAYGRTWFTKMQRVGLMSDGNESDGGGEDLRIPITRIEEKEEDKESRCKAVVSCFAMRKPMRDAIRDTMQEKGVRAIFVILQITLDTLSGRTLGAEEPELAESIMREKEEDLEIPEEDERDVIVVDSMSDVDDLTTEIKEAILVVYQRRESDNRKVDGLR